MMRTSRSNTISSIGRRSYETRPELMIFCIPVRFSPPAGPSSKPSRLSISAWLSTRAGWAGGRRLAAFGLGAPGGGQFFVGLLPAVRGVVAHWISIWVNSTSVMRAGAAARLARPISSSRSR